jgi:hypothetical protein
MRNTRAGIPTLVAAASIMVAGAWAPPPDIAIPPQPSGPSLRQHKSKTSHKQNARRSKKGGKR